MGMNKRMGIRVQRGWLRGLVVAAAMATPCIALAGAPPKTDTKEKADKPEKADKSAPSMDALEAAHAKHTARAHDNASKLSTLKVPPERQADHDKLVKAWAKVDTFLAKIKTIKDPVVRAAKQKELEETIAHIEKYQAIHTSNLKAAPAAGSAK
jgi:hypothetical protein